MNVATKQNPAKQVLVQNHSYSPMEMIICSAYSLDIYLTKH